MAVVVMTVVILEVKVVVINMHSHRAATALILAARKEISSELNLVLNVVEAILKYMKA